MRRFVREVEEHILDASPALPADASVAQLQMVAAQAVLATFLESGMEFASVVQLFDQVFGRRMVDAAWLRARVSNEEIAAGLKEISETGGHSFADVLGELRTP
jgi:hypothetical protein